MKTERLTDAQIRALGWQALVDKLGYAGALRYSIQTEGGQGNYPEWRHRTLGHLSVNQLLSRMRSTKNERQRRRAP